MTEIGDGDPRSSEERRFRSSSPFFLRERARTAEPPSGPLISPRRGQRWHHVEIRVGGFYLTAHATFRDDGEGVQLRQRSRRREFLDRRVHDFLKSRFRKARKDDRRTHWQGHDAADPVPSSYAAGTSSCGTSQGTIAFDEICRRRPARDREQNRRRAHPGACDAAGHESIGRIFPRERRGFVAFHADRIPVISFSLASRSPRLAARRGARDRGSRWPVFADVGTGRHFWRSFPQSSPPARGRRIHRKCATRVSPADRTSCIG